MDRDASGHPGMGREAGVFRERNQTPTMATNTSKNWADAWEIKTTHGRAPLSGILGALGMQNDPPPANETGFVQMLISALAEKAGPGVRIEALWNGNVLLGV